jgi:hypothetical protein
MQGTLLDVIDRLGEVDDSDRYHSPCLFAEGGSRANPAARALVCPGGGSRVCPQDPSLRYVLMVQQAREAIEVWSSWRGGRLPSREEKFAAVMYYSRHDAFLPVENGGA